MSEPVPQYRVEELTEAEQAQLAEEMEHRFFPSCQSDAVSDGESDLSMRRDDNKEDLHEEEVE